MIIRGGSSTFAMRPHENSRETYRAFAKLSARELESGFQDNAWLYWHTTLRNSAWPATCVSITHIPWHTTVPNRHTVDGLSAMAWWAPSAMNREAWQLYRGLHRFTNTQTHTHTHTHTNTHTVAHTHSMSATSVRLRSARVPTRVHYGSLHTWM